MNVKLEHIEGWTAQANNSLPSSFTQNSHGCIAAGNLSYFIRHLFQRIASANNSFVVVLQHDFFLELCACSFLLLFGLGYFGKGRFSGSPEKIMDMPADTIALREQLLRLNWMIVIVEDTNLAKYPPVLWAKM